MNCNLPAFLAGRCDRRRVPDAEEVSFKGIPKRLDIAVGQSVIQTSGAEQRVCMLVKPIQLAELLADRRRCKISGQERCSYCCPESGQAQIINEGRAIERLLSEASEIDEHVTFLKPAAIGLRNERIDDGPMIGEHIANVK